MKGDLCFKGDEVSKIDSGVVIFLGDSVCNGDEVLIGQSVNGDAIRKEPRENKN